MELYQQHEQHHRDRSAYWLEKGRPDYAQGSLRKAAKWQTKRREFDYVMNGAYPKNAMDDFIDQYIQERAQRMVKKFEDAIFGTPETER